MNPVTRTHESPDSRIAPRVWSARTGEQAGLPAQRAIVASDNSNLNEGSRPAGPIQSEAPRSEPRDERKRELYARLALAEVPRLLTALDRNPFRGTHGSFDRQYWHYRTAAFASEMYQEAVGVLALVWQQRLPDNRWHGDELLAEWIRASLGYSVRSMRRDGACDDYYPFEGALGAAVFSLVASTTAYEALGLRDEELLAGLVRRGEWIARHGESGVLANHHALAALALSNLAEISADARWHERAQARASALLAMQHDEGWFEEYGGADPGYHTLTIECLASLRRAWKVVWLDEPLSRAITFARQFQHADGTTGGVYGSRGSWHFYPHGFELLAAENADAADLADGFLRAADKNRMPSMSDDRLVAHRLMSLLAAYRDWAPRRATQLEDEPSARALNVQTSHDVCWLPGAQLAAARGAGAELFVSAARGGAWRMADAQGNIASEAALVVELDDGRVLSSDWHRLDRQVVAQNAVDAGTEGNRGAATDREAIGWHLCVSGPLWQCRYETATPFKQAVLHLAMCVLRSWGRNIARRLLQGRAITHARSGPVQLNRTIAWDGLAGRVVVRDTIRLTSPRPNVRRMALAAEHQGAYVAASQLWQPSLHASWTDLGRVVDELNRTRSVTIERGFP